MKQMNYYLFKSLKSKDTASNLGGFVSKYKQDLAVSC